MRVFLKDYGIKKNVFKYKIEILSVTLITVSVLFLLSLNYLNKGKNNQNVASKAARSGGITVDEPANRQIAEKTIDCLESMKDTDGRYLYGRSCKGDSFADCFDIPSNNSGPVPIWSRFQYYQATKDFRELEAIRDDLEINTTKIPTLQNDFWNCRLMAELYESADFSSLEKEQIRKICLTGVYNPRLLALAKTDSKNGINTFPRSAFYASDFIGRYAISAKKEDLTTAQSFYKMAFNAYLNINSSQIDQDACVLGIAAADLYKVTGQDSYLDFARSLGEQLRTSERLNSFEEKTFCAYFVDVLHKTTNNDEYRLTKEKIVDSLKMNFDTAGDSCFWSDKQDGKTVKTTLLNAINAFLFLEK